MSIKPHKDFLGCELNRGDQVVSIVPNYRELRRCYIVDMTPQKVRLCQEPTYDDIWDTFLQNPNQVVKITDPLPSKTP